MAPQVTKAKSAFQFFQAGNIKEIKNELGISMGAAMTELSTRWKSMSEGDKDPYFAKEAEDRERYRKESVIADAKATSEQLARRKNLVAQDGEEASMRGERMKLMEARQHTEKEKKRRKEELEAQMDPEILAERKRIKDEKRAQTMERKRKRDTEEKKLQDRHKKMDKEAKQAQKKRLEYLLGQSSIFAKLKLGHGSASGKGEEVEEAESKEEPYHPHHRDGTKPSKKKTNGTNGDSNGNIPNGEEEDPEESSEHVFLTRQPDSIKFGTLKPYQLEGLNWMIHLAEKGLNGILADEMGLGKTLQSISILAYQFEYQNIQGPHLICVPKSTLSNWMNEFARWCPCLRVIKFHGSREDRAEMIQECFTHEAASHDGRRPTKQMVNEETGDMEDDNTNNPRQWDVCVTTYEVCNMEKKALEKIPWKYLVIDEAHRLKNEASMFSATVRSFSTAHRLLLTGTPLQNNLHELWALLNFLLPDIFTSSDQFDDWFNLETDDADAKKEMISQLHKVLRPFMLRRLKVDVAKGLPPKTETLVMVGMSKMQKQLYKKLLLRDIESITSTNTKNKTTILNIVMQLRKCCGHPYLFEGVEDRSLDPLGEHLIENCGKLSMVDKLLKRLKERGSRVLIFTQMTRVLDILEDFMVMKGYKYCRIDGNTDYDVREASIDGFNAPNSEKFVFILSTRAGGLGINLQTADTCILYDSDWNPQADLQAQDRCHRLGQKKPVSVYRLVSENTIEEKIVERAQQKLKLDAMVVQQGRLKEKDKVSKEDIMSAIRFGADTVFRSEESTITDEDIDAILARGEAKTKELAEKIQKADKGDLLDFRLDGGVSAQTFEGIDYSDRELRNQLRLLAADSMGKRERRAPPTSYVPVTEVKKIIVVNNEKIRLPKVLRLPRMEDHQFYNRERLLELSKIEFQTYAKLKQNNQLPPKEVIEEKQSLLPHEFAEEKLRLLEEGFGDWTRSQFFQFAKAAAKYGPDDIENIALEVDLPIERVNAYSKAFWMYGATELKKEEWERLESSITKGKQKIEKQRKMRDQLNIFVKTFQNPRTDMVFANKGTAHFALEQDRALLCAVDKYGYGNWELVREALAKDNELMFQHIAQGMNSSDIAKRCDYRLRQMERELEARGKRLKNTKPANVVAAEKALEGIKEMDQWENEAISLEMLGKDPPSLQSLSEESKSIMEDRLKDRNVILSRFREVEIQLRGCQELAHETKKCIKRGDQYVNYSHITLKAGGMHITNGGKLADIDGVDMEAYINKFVLSVPECGECKSCCDNKSRKICLRRVEARKQKMAEFDIKVKEWFKMHGHSVKKVETKINSRQYWPRNRDAIGASTSKSKGVSILKAKVSPPGNPLGNKRMAVSEELIPDFCKRITANGTRKRMQTINEFVKDHPEASIRQVTFKFADLTTKDRPECIPVPEKPKGKGRAFTFYLRPRLYRMLPENDRPKDWERFAKEDELKWQDECRKAKELKDIKAQKMKDIRGDLSQNSDVAINAAASQEADDETEDDEPPSKKVKTD